MRCLGDFGSRRHINAFPFNRVRAIVSHAADGPHRWTGFQCSAQYKTNFVLQFNNDISKGATIMDIPDIHDLGVQATLQTWFNETGELFVDLYYPHSGGSGWFYLLTSPTNVKQLIEQAHEGALFFLLKQKQFPLRGIVDDTFINQATAAIPDGEDYLITDLAIYPQHVSFLGDGQTHKQLLADLDDLRGVLVGVGREPDTNPAYWKEDTRQDRLTAMKKGR